MLDSCFEMNVSRNGYRVEEIDIGDTTFIAGQSESVHRWYRLTPSFSPAVVRYFIDYFDVDAKSMILDPFSGRGTTVIECQKRGIEAVGFEINPILSRAGQYSLSWGLYDADAIDLYVNTLQECISWCSDKSVEDVLQILATSLPNIYNVFRWWKPEVLRDLLVARQVAGYAEFTSIKECLWLALTKTSIDCANIHRNHPTITFDDAHKRRIDVYEAIQSNLREQMDDIRGLTAVELANCGMGSVELRDSSQDLPDGHKCLGGITNVITSPPYPNRFSYVQQTRPQLYFMEVIQERVEATEIDLVTIGGTWGRATSELSKSLIVPDEAVLDCLDYYDRLQERSVLMCNYATKYFVDLNRHFAQLRKWASSEFQAVYIVGNSRLKGVDVFTESIVADLLRLNGFSVEGLLVFRKRGGRKGLYETAVLVGG